MLRRNNFMLTYIFTCIEYQNILMWKDFFFKIDSEIKVAKFKLNPESILRPKLKKQDQDQDQEMRRLDQVD